MTQRGGSESRAQRAARAGPVRPWVRADHIAGLRQSFDADRLARYNGEEPKKLVVLPGGHFEAYTGENFTTSSAVQRDWFTTHLGGAP